MDNRKINANFIYNLAGSLVTIISPLITAPYVSRVLGVDGVGLYSYSYANVTYFMLFAALGSTAYAQREIAYSRKNTEKISQIFWQVIVFRLFTSLVALFGYFIIFSKSMTLLILTQCLNILVVTTDITWLFQGVEEFKKTSLRGMLIKLFFIIYVFLFVNKEEDLIIYAGGYAIIQIIANISLWFFASKYIRWTRVKMKSVFRIFWPSFLLFIPTIATQIYTVLDKTMIGIMTDTSTQNGLYEQAEKIVRIGLTIPAAYSAVVAPRISAYSAQEKNEDIKNTITNSLSCIWFMVLPMCAGIIAIAGNFVPWFYGKDFEGAIQLLRIFAFLFIPVGIAQVLAVQYLVPTKKQNVFTFSVIIGAVVNFTLNSIFISRYYALGATISSVIAETVITTVQIIYIVKVDKILTIKEIFAPGYKYLISAAFMFILITPISSHLTPCIISTLLIIILGILIYCIVLFIMKDEMIHSILRAFKGRFGK